MMMSVQARDEMLWKAENAIMNRVGTPTGTADLIRQLKIDEIDEYFVRAAILFLLDRGRLQMTSDQKLVAAP
jgi:hypothetical protein